MKSELLQVINYLTYLLERSNNILVQASKKYIEETLDEAVNIYIGIYIVVPKK